MLAWLLLLFVSPGLAWKRAVVIDAGSTGSRVHVTTWRRGSPECGEKGIEIQLPVLTWKHSPGISTFLEDHHENRNAALKKYLGDLYTGLLELVPSATDRRNVPVWFLGTGGMRGIPNPDELIKKIHDILKSEWKPFRVSHQRAVAILTGEEEAIYSWIALLHVLNHEDQKSSHLQSRSLQQLKQRPVMVELGGASTQVVANPPASHNIIDPRNSNFVTLNVCGESQIVYAKSHQGFGRQLALQRFLCMGYKKQKELADKVTLPCLPTGLRFPIFTDCELSAAIEDIGVIDEDLTIEGIRGITNGTFEICKSEIEKLLFEQELQLPFNLTDSSDVIATESFYHLYSMVLDPTGALASTVTLEHFRSRARELCKLSTIDSIVPLLHSRAEFEKAVTACFGLTFAADLLGKLLSVSDTRPIRVLNKIRGIDLGWPIGHNLLELPQMQRSIAHDEL